MEVKSAEKIYHEKRKKKKKQDFLFVFFGSIHQNHQFVFFSPLHGKNSLFTGKNLLLTKKGP